MIYIMKKKLCINITNCFIEKMLTYLSKYYTSLINKYNNTLNIIKHHRYLLSTTYAVNRDFNLLQHKLLYMYIYIPVLSKLREYCQNKFESDSKNNITVNDVLNDAYYIGSHLIFKDNNNNFHLTYHKNNA